MAEAEAEASSEIPGGDGKSMTRLAEDMLSHLKADFVDYEPNSQVAKFYANRSVFITGATGFIGKALVEKLIRSCKDIKRIYLLIREKRGLDIKDRLVNILESPVSFLSSFLNYLFILSLIFFYYYSVILIF